MSSSVYFSRLFILVLLSGNHFRRLLDYYCWNQLGIRCKKATKHRYETGLNISYMSKDRKVLKKLHSIVKEVPFFALTSVLYPRERGVKFIRHTMRLVSCECADFNVFCKEEVAESMLRWACPHLNTWNVAAAIKKSTPWMSSCVYISLDYK